ncbi:hypothetical protein HYV88_01665 [Candidatus Woesearchaeota archaeon]|nr:hypothetical protein [Candidatus Woesearchaeota archaeon]
MSSQLNEPGKYELFPGRIVDQMPLLIKSGRSPLSVQGLMQRKQEVLAFPMMKLNLLGGIIILIQEMVLLIILMVKQKLFVAPKT